MYAPKRYNFRDPTTLCLIRQTYLCAFSKKLELEEAQKVTTAQLEDLSDANNWRNAPFKIILPNQA